MGCLIGLVMFAYYQEYPMSPQQMQAAPDQVRGPPPTPSPPYTPQGPSGRLQKGPPPWVESGCKVLHALSSPAQRVRIPAPS